MSENGNGKLGVDVDVVLHGRLSSAPEQDSGRYTGPTAVWAQQSSGEGPPD